MKNELLRSYNLTPDFAIKLINVSENQTYRIDCSDGQTFALRVARPMYHTHAEYNSEIAWIEALRTQTPIRVAKPIAGHDGNYVQNVHGQSALMFEWVEGAEPKIGDDLEHLATQLGALSARLHDHALHWEKPPLFTRPRWDFDAAFGTKMRWGDWRKGLGVEAHMLPLLSRTVNEVECKLAVYGHGPQRFNLIHGDLRLANLLRDGDHITLIDFDDCGFGWLMYDAATLISFHEHEPQAAQMIMQWINAYRTRRVITPEDQSAIHTLIMFRRILLLAWLGSHSEIELASEVKATFALQSLDLCERFLTFGSVF